MLYSYCLQTEPVLSEGKNMAHEKLIKHTRLKKLQRVPRFTTAISCLQEDGLLGLSASCTGSFRGAVLLSGHPCQDWLFGDATSSESSTLLQTTLIQAPIRNSSKHTSSIKQTEIEQFLQFVMCALPRVKRHLFMSPQKKS